MTGFDAFALGLVQGLTEFLPVSSSGHLVIGQALLGVTLPGITFEIVVHMATLLSVMIVYRERLLGLLGGALRREPDALGYVGLLALGTLPAGVVGVGFGEPIERLFESPLTVGFALLATGTILFSSRWALARQDRAAAAAGTAPEASGADGGRGAVGAGSAAGRRPIGALTVRIALLIGLAQCVALVPGISRSGSTVVAALWLGVPAVEAAAFSFLLSIPAVAGAAILQVPELTSEGGGVGALPLGIGFVVAAVSGVAAIALLVRMLRNRSFPHFAWYCWGAGALFLAWMTLGPG